MQTQSRSRLFWFWPLVLIGIGVLLLLDNFLLLDINVMAYWPVLLVVAGFQLLLRGDIALSWRSQTFGITRGSVEAGNIEIESGEVDVQLRALRKPGRLIAGQYTAHSRPSLRVRNNQAMLQMRRGQTWWLSMADWDIGLAHDLPWDLLVSSYLGQLEMDLRGLVINRAYIASGIGNVSIACPSRASGPIFARSTFGDVRISIPADLPATITIKQAPFARVHINRARFDEIAPGVFRTRDGSDDPISSELAPTGAAPTALNLTASTTFGAIYIA